jgi:hypothetical protein
MVTGNRQLETGDWALETGNWQLTANESPDGTGDRLHAFSARPDDWVDELTVRIFIAVIYQLGHCIASIGSFVVNAAEIQRTQGIVFGPDDVQAGKPPAEVLEDIP